MKRYIYILIALFFSLTSNAQAFLTTDPNGTILQYEVNDGDTVVNRYYVLRGMERRPEGIWMEVEIKKSLKQKGVLMKLLHNQTSLSMDIGGLLVDIMDMDEDVTEELRDNSNGELLSIPLQHREGKLPLESFDVSLRISRFLKVGAKIGWKEKEIVGRETLELPLGKYDTFKLKGQVRAEAKFALLKKGVNLKYVFWIAPGIGVVQFERNALDSREVYRLVKKIYPQI